MPLHRRLPKFGFTNINKVVYKTVNIEAIEKLAQKTGATVIGQNELVAAGLVSKNDKVKILGTGALTKSGRYRTCFLENRTGGYRRAGRNGC